jgi:hypothetical protein
VTPSTEIIIGDIDAQHVLIRPLFRSHPDLFDVKDGNWIDCELEIAAGAFSGRFRADLRSDEFQSWSEELQGLSRTLDGTATFSTLDGQIAFSLTGDGTGQVRVTGEAIDAAESGNRLQFRFDVDRMQLPRVCEALVHLLGAFPVVGAPDAEQA